MRSLKNSLFAARNIFSTIQKFASPQRALRNDFVPKNRPFVLKHGICGGLASRRMDSKKIVNSGLEIVFLVFQGSQNKAHVLVLEGSCSSARFPIFFYTIGFESPIWPCLQCNCKEWEKRDIRGERRSIPRRRWRAFRSISWLALMDLIYGNKRKKQSICQLGLGLLLKSMNPPRGRENHVFPKWEGGFPVLKDNGNPALRGNFLFGDLTIEDEYLQPPNHNLSQTITYS